MPRRLRQTDEARFAHISAHAVAYETLFRDDEDRIAYRLMLAATVARYGWHCLSYCLMGTHLHLLVEAPQPALGQGIRWMHGHYGRCFNKQHRRSGHLFHGRYHFEPIREDRHFLNVVGYIPMNPVVARLCDRPEQWEWSSHFDVSVGNARPWLAHDRLVEHLEAMAGAGAYDHLIATRAGLIDTNVTEGSDPSVWVETERWRVAA